MLGTTNIYYIIMYIKYMYTPSDSAIIAVVFQQLYH